MWFKLVLMSLWLTVLMSVHGQVMALDCGVAADPWYSVEAVVEAELIPTGVKVEARYLDSINELELIFSNSGSEPLYLISETFPGAEYGGSNHEDPGTPLGYEPLAKLVGDEVYTYDMVNAYGAFGWKKSPDDSYRMVLGREVSSKQVYADNRPPELDIPTEEEISYQIFYDGKLIDLPVTIFYSLNEDYNPKAFLQSQKECDKAQRTWLLSMEPWHVRLFAWLSGLFGFVR